MPKYLSKTASGVYRIELESGSVEITVSEQQDQETMDQLLDDSQDDVVTIDGDTFVSPAVFWKPFEIADILRNYDESAANEWCAREFGGLSRLLKRVMAEINSQFYGTAADLLNEIEKLSYTMDQLPCIISAVFDTEEEREEFLRALGGDEDDE